MEDKAKPTYSILSYQASKLPEQYVNMVFSKWLRSLRYGNDYFKLIDSDSYFENYNAFISHIIRKPETVVNLAILPKTEKYPEVVLGFSIFRGPILDYVHVRRDGRNQGIGLSLIPKDITTITHLTKIGMSIWSAKFPEIIFNPFA